MATNEEMLQKAAITTDAIAAAGKLNTKQADKFIDYVIEETAWMQNARVVKVDGDSFDIDKIGVGKRVAVPAAEAKDPALRRGITTSKVTMTPKEIMVPFEIGDSFLETNIQGASVEDAIVKMMARKAANDSEELHILGDLLGVSIKESDYVDGGSANQIKDTYLALYDGWLRQSDAAHIYNAAGANISASVFSAMIRSMPTKFRRDRQRLRWLMSSDLAQLWRERLSTRATTVGDQALASGGNIGAFGIPIVEIPLMPLKPRVVQHVALAGNPGTVTALRYAPVANVIVTPSTLAGVPTVPYVSGVDYVLDAAAGTIARIQGGALSDPQTVKITYDANPQVLLSHADNFIIAISRNIRIEKQRDIWRRTTGYAITMKVAASMEEVDAAVKAINIGTGI